MWIVPASQVAQSSKALLLVLGMGWIAAAACGGPTDDDCAEFPSTTCQPDGSCRQ
jgi:hypothetical protein